MTGNSAGIGRGEELAARLARRLATPRVREIYDSLVSGKHDWEFKPNGEANRTRPYPAGFYPDDPNLYYAISWGCHEYMFPHERWLVRRAAALRARQPQQPKD